MTTCAQILAFVKSKARISSVETTRDADITLSINAAYRRVAYSDFYPFLRVAVTTAITAGTQDYALPADFGQIAAEGVRVYQNNTTTYQYLQMVNVPDADLWENMQSIAAPKAFRIVAGTDNLLRKIRLLPAFTAIGYMLGYTYYKRVADVSGSDVLGSPLICDAVAFWSLAQDKDWNRDPDVTERNYEGQFQEALKQARMELFS